LRRRVLRVLFAAVAAAACPLAPAAAQTVQESPLGWAVHTIGFDENWQVDRWIAQARQSGAGWIRDGVYLETYVYPDNPDGAFIPIPNSNPARWLDRDAIRAYVDEAAKILEGGFHLVLSPMASTDPGDEGTAGPAMLEILDRLRERLGANAPYYLARITIEHFNEPNIYVEHRLDIHLEPARYVEIAAELYTALKGNALYRNIPIVVGATAHFGVDFRCGNGWTPGGLQGVPANPPTRCAQYTTGGQYNSLAEFGLGYLRQILDLGIMAYADGFTAHPYRGTSAPELGFSLIAPEQDQEGFVNEIRMWVDRIERYNTTGKPLIYQFTEIGYPSSPTGFGAGSQQRQGDYLTRSWTVLFHESLLARKKLEQHAPGGYRLTSVHYNTLKDDCIAEGPFNTLPCGADVPDQEKTTGALTWDLQPKVAFNYFTQLTNVLRPDELEAAELSGITVSGVGAPVYKRLFRRKDGTGWLLALWTGTRDVVDAAVDVSIALDHNILQVRRTDLASQGSAPTIQIPFVRNGGGIVLPHIRLPNRVTFFQLRTSAPVANDFDGDGRSDLVIWRPSDGTWRWLESSTGYATASAHVKQWGRAGDVPVSGDFDGDGLADIAVWRPCDAAAPPCGARWYWLTSSTGYNYTAQQNKQWGAPGDIPVSADFDGDGKTDLAVWRPSSGTWYVLSSSTGYDYAAQWGWQWGAPTDIPVPADFDGDGKTDLAVWRPSTGVWFWLISSAGYDYRFQQALDWGSPGDTPIACDYDQDGRADLAIWRPSDSTWYILFSSSGFVYGDGFVQGVNGEQPLIADFDGDGQLDTAFFQASTGRWTVLGSGSGGTFTYTWGSSGDVPVIRR
jgi:hypothetical protein